jgi:hypothetical protein
MAIILKANKVNLFVPSVLFVFCYHSPNYLDTPRTKEILQPKQLSHFPSTLRFSIQRTAIGHHFADIASKHKYMCNVLCGFSEMSPV